MFLCIVSEAASIVTSPLNHNFFITKLCRIFFIKNLVFRVCSSSGPNHFLLFPLSLSLTKGRRKIYRLEELSNGTQVVKRGRGCGGEREQRGILGWVMNTTGVGFNPLLQPPNTHQPVNAVQFWKCEILVR